MNLKKLLKDKLSEDEIDLLPRSFDVIGDIVQVGLPEELKPKWNLIAEVIMKQHKNVKTIVNKMSATEGVERIRRVQVIAGDKKTETLHKENGCRFMLDLNRVFFTGRLSEERMRIAKLVKENWLRSRNHAEFRHKLNLIGPREAAMLDPMAPSGAGIDFERMIRRTQGLVNCSISNCVDGYLVSAPMVLLDQLRKLLVLINEETEVLTCTDIG